MTHDTPVDAVDLFDVEFDDLELDAVPVPMLDIVPAAAAPHPQLSVAVQEGYEPAPTPPAGTLIQFPTPEPEPEPVVAMLETSRRTVTATRTLVLQGQTLAEEAVALQVVDRATCERGEVLYHDLCEVEKAILADYEKSCHNAYVAWKGLTDERAEQLNPVVEAKKTIGPRVAGWKADIERQENEAQRAREAAARKEQQENAQRAARQAVQEGDVVTAAAIVEEAKHLPAPILPRAPSAAPSTGLTTTRKPWKAQIDDLVTLLAAIVNQKDAAGARNLTEFDDAIAAAVLPLLNRQATTLKSELGKRYPGTTGTQKPTLAGR